jgi:hypothetical protein
MLSFRLPFAALAAVLLAFAPSLDVSAAPVAVQSPFGTSVDLTPERIENFLTSYPAFLEMAQRLHEKYGTSTDKTKPSAQDFAMLLTLQGAISDLNTQAQSFGFKDYMDWLNTTNSVIMAYATARDGGNFDTQIQAAIDKINAMEKLTSTQKKVLIERLTSSSGPMAAMRPSQGNIDAVTPYADRIKVVLEPQDNQGN